MTEENHTSVSDDFLIILRTIFSFLDNHNFKKTLNVFNKECEELGLSELVIDNLTPSDTTYTKNVSDKDVSKDVSKSEKLSKTTKEKGIEVTYNLPIVNIESEDTEKLLEEGTEEELLGSCNDEELTPRKSDLTQLTDSPINTDRIKQYLNDQIEKRDTATQYYASSAELKSKKPKAPQNSPMNNANLVKETALKRRNSRLSSSSETKETQLSSFDESSDYNDLKERFMVLQDEHRRLMEITAKLTVAFQRNIKGQTESMNTILNNCKEIYPELFSTKSNSKNYFTITKEEFRECITQEFTNLETKHSSNSSSFSTDTFDESTATTDVKSMQVEEIPPDLPSNFPLDFQKLKTDLRNGDATLRLALLQALRWRITRNPACIRNDVMASYERFDLLDIRNCTHRNGSPMPKTKFLDSFYCPKKTPDILQESMARLINTIASMKTGRDYLTRQSILMNYLLVILMDKHTLKPKLDTKTREMTISTMQKMSLRYWQRVTMINAGVCKYMVKYLSDNYKKLSSYCLEYSTALLMNLWLHVDAREKSRPIVNDIIKLLATLLDIKYENCLPYINGSLYSLLPDQHFHKVAKEVKLGQIIEYRIPTADPDMREQLRVILKIYHDPSNWQPMCDCDIGSEIENEIDLFEPELDEHDKFFTKGQSGEQLLYNYRLLFSINGSQVCSTTLILRPMTPSYTKRTSFAVTPMSPYVKDENSLIIQDSIVSIQYHELKELLFNKFDVINNDLYFKNETGDIIIDNDSANEKEKNEKIKENVDVKNSNVEIEEKVVQNNKTTKKEKIETKKNITEKKKVTKAIPKLKSTKNKVQKQDNKDKNNNKNKPKQQEKEFCETTQQFYHKPNKNQIFETKSELTVPSFAKNQVYDKKNISLPNSPHLPSTPVGQKSCPATARGDFESLNAHPVHLHPNCYKQNYKSVCFCSSDDKNNKKVNRYACCCYEKLKQSFEKEHNENNKNLSPDRNRHGSCNVSCKYTNLTDENKPRNERDSGVGSRPLDEDDYEAVFESRPRILRTP